MHREHLVVLIGVQHFSIRSNQLQTNEQRFDTTHDEEEERGNAVHNAELLMVDCDDPITPTC